MSKLLFNGFRDLRKSFSELLNKYNEFRFGLSLISDKRKDYYFKAFMSSLSASTAGLYFTYNTLLLDNYKSIVHSYDSADLLPLNEDLKTIANNVWKDCNERQKSYHLLTFFPSVGSEPICFGTLGLPTGAIVGLPHNLTYNTVEDVKTVEMRFLGEHNPHMKWRSEAGKAFIESLVLSQRAKKFIIGRQIYLLNNFNLFIDCLNVCLSTLLAIGLGQQFIKRNKSLQKFGNRFIVRSLSLVTGVYVWFTFNQMISYYLSLRADKMTVVLGEEYMKGAIEYYSKLKTRNAAFHVLNEHNSREVYTEKGEIKGLLTSRWLTISRRLDYLNAFEKQIQFKNITKN